VRTRDAIAGSIVLWTWPDGWRMVRPVSDASLWRMHEEAQAHFYHPERDQLLDWSAHMSLQTPAGRPGAAGVAFVVRPLRAPAGRPELGDGEQICAVLSFVILNDGLLKIRMYPGNYDHVPPDLLRHAYDVLVYLRPVTSTMHDAPTMNGAQLASSLEDPHDAQEKLLQPHTILSPHLLEDVAQVVHGSSVSSLGPGGGSPWQVESSLATYEYCSAVFADKNFGLRLSTDLRRRGAVPEKYRFVVSVSSGKTKPWLPDVRRIVGDEIWNEVRARKLWPDGGSEHVPFVVSVPYWGETHRHEVLGEALLLAGIVARDREDLVATLRRRSIPGLPHPSFELSILLGIVPDLLVASWNELPSLVEGRP